MKSISNLRDYVVSMLSNMIRINSENPPGREDEIASYVALAMKSISNLRDYVVSMLSNMIRINSENPPGREDEIASYVAERLAELGLKAWIDRFQGRANALGSIKIGDGRKMMLISHLDTVPAGEKELWRIPPFSGIVKDGRVYGRGAADAKGCIASMLGCLKSLADEGWPINGEIIFAAVADEESENRGVRRLIAQGVKADYAVVGEPTNLNVCIAHRGSIFLRASFIGKAAHSSKPEKGVNAVYAASEYALIIEKLSKRFKVKHKLLGKPSYLGSRAWRSQSLGEELRIT